MNHNEIDIQKVMDRIRPQLVAFKEKAGKQKGKIMFNIEITYDGLQYNSTYASSDTIGKREPL